MQYKDTMTLFIPLAEQIGSKLKQLGHSVSVAESATGGLISANLLAVPGASSYFVGSAVVYTLQSRRKFLDFDKTRVKNLKPMSQDMVMEFALTMQAKLDTTWAIAELGAAGPGGTPYGHGPGVCVLGLAGPKPGFTLVETGSDNRAENMQAFTQAALMLFQRSLEQL